MAVEPNAQGLATVEIVLPDNLVIGRVVDAAGRAVERAGVTLWNTTSVQRTDSGPDGRFQFRGVDSGLARLSATERSTRRSSEEISVLVVEDDSGAPVVLRLRETRRLTGRVVSTFGPVPGARVVAFPLRPAPAPGQDARTDIDGSFGMDVPQRTSSALLVVSPPGQALRVVERPVGEAPAEVAVSSAGGTLEVSWLAPGAEIEEGKSLSLAVDGLPLPGAELAQWAIGHGERFETPTGLRVGNLAPGTYRACVGPKLWNGLDLPDPRHPAVHCDEGYLAPGGELVLAPAADPDGEGYSEIFDD